MPMNLESLSISLRDAACETLENLAFTEVTTKVQGEWSKPNDAHFGASLSLGELGLMHLGIERDFLIEIAEVLYSPGPEGVDPALLPDTLAEILNIIAGRYLEAIHGGKSDFVMGLPNPNSDSGIWSRLPMRWLLAAEDGKELAIGLDMRPG